MSRKKDSEHTAFLNEYYKTHDFEAAVKKAGVSHKTAKQYMYKYKNKFVAIFERLGMPQEDVFKKHIELMDNPVKSDITDFAKGVNTKTFDIGVKLKAIELFYKLTKSLDEDNVVINNVNVTDTDKLKELEIAKYISEDKFLTEKFMNVIETSGKGDNK